MIRIHLTDHSVVDTTRHTYEQATAAKAAGVGILVGGPTDVHDFTATTADLFEDDGADETGPTPERVLQPQDIASIERVAR